MSAAVAVPTNFYQFQESTSLCLSNRKLVFHTVSTANNVNIFDPPLTSRTELLDARGTLEPQNLSLMFQLSIKKILTNATDMATSQSVIYPAGLKQNVTSGVQHLKDTIDSGLEDCPDQKYFLFGYSQGATLVLETLEKISKASTEAVAGVILVGNPYRLPGRRSNVNHLGERDHRQSLGRFATQAKKENGTIPIISKDLDASGRVLDICLDVSLNSEDHDCITRKA